MRRTCSSYLLSGPCWILLCSLSSHLPRSKRLGSLPRLTCPRDGIAKFPPTNRKHDAPLLAPRHDNAKLVLTRAHVVVGLIAQADDGAADQIADAERVLDAYLVLFGGANVLAADLGLEGLATDGGVDDEDLAGGEARAEACDLREDDAGDLGQDGAAAAGAGA